MGHPFAEGEPVYDVTFENVQAGLRTDYLFRLANQRRGFVIGTGDLSRAGARLVHLRRRRPDEPLRRQCRRAEDADPVSDPLGGRAPTSSTRRPTRCSRRSSTPRSRPSWSRPTRAAAIQSTEAQDRPLRAARFLPATTSCATASRRRRSPSSPGTPGRTPETGLWPLDFPEAARRAVRPRDDPQVARGLPAGASSQLQPVQALGHPERPQGLGRRRALARAATGARRPTRTAAPWLDELKRNVPSA